MGLCFPPLPAHREASTVPGKRSHPRQNPATAPDTFYEPASAKQQNHVRSLRTASPDPTCSTQAPVLPRAASTRYPRTKSARKGAFGERNLCQPSRVWGQVWETSSPRGGREKSKEVLQGHESQGTDPPSTTIFQSMSSPRLNSPAPRKLSSLPARGKGDRALSALLITSPPHNLHIGLEEQRQSSTASAGLPALLLRRIRASRQGKPEAAMPPGSRRAEAGCVPFSPFQMHFSFKNK